MGQTISDHFESLKDDVMKEAHILKEVMEITHEEFKAKIIELNKICRKSIECESRKLHFYIRRNSDATFVWKQTVRVICMRVVVTEETADLPDDAIEEVNSSLSTFLSTPGSQVEVYKVLGLRQFLLAYKMITYHFNCIQQGALPTQEQKNEYLQVPISTSMIIDKIMSDTEKSESEECIICMERKPEVTLPCAHAYCLFCIEQWNVSNKTCPVCRAEMENTDDSWVTPEIPESSEINAEIQKALTVITLKLPEQ